MRICLGCVWGKFGSVKADVQGCEIEAGLNRLTSTRDARLTRASSVSHSREIESMQRDESIAWMARVSSL